MNLIEVLISIAISIILGWLVFQFSAEFYSGMVSKTRFNNTYIENYCALDHISRMVRAASSDLDCWPKRLENEIVYCSKEISFGYFFEKSETHNSLFFITGTYENGAWKNSRKNLISKSLTGINFEFNKDSNNLLICKLTFCSSQNSLAQNTKNLSGQLIGVLEKDKKEFELVRSINMKNGSFRCQN